MKLQIFLTAVSICYAVDALAWQPIRCILPINQGKQKNWRVKEYKPVVDPVSFPKDSPQYAALLDAIAQMNQNPSQFRITLAGFDTDGVAVHNGESEIWMKDLGEKYTGVSAIEQSDADFSPTCTATESDIIINTNYRPTREPIGTSKIDYSNDKPVLFDYGGSYANFRAIVMHELGHSAGLQHEGEIMNLMGGDNLLVSNGDNVQPYIGQDAAAGLIALHGLSAKAKEDVSVSHWRYGEKTAGGGGSFFSVHHRTRIFNTQGVELGKECPYRKPEITGALITQCPEPIYHVSQGQRVKVELSYENAGKSRTLAVKANYYLSSDNHIDPQDTLLTSRTLSLKQNSKPLTTTTELLIPHNINKGQHYWLGCMIDADDKLPESIETNNATYIGIIVD